MEIRGFRYRWITLCLWLGCVWLRGAAGAEPTLAEALAVWGTDHVGKPVPEYVTGDECLFCHRDIGSRWGENQHQRSMRRATANSRELQDLQQLTTQELAREVNLLLGGSQATRYLKRAAEYGKLSLLSTVHYTGSEVTDPQTAQWDHERFAASCAGCHTTAVDPATQRFAALSLDCFVCHGDVPLGHTKDTRLVMLSQQRRDGRRVASICGQCHLRGGKSASTSRPYPTNFVAGDNLFRDFHVDLSDQALRKFPPQQRHLYENARDAGQNPAALSCVDCHTVHPTSTVQHQQLPPQPICATCHVDQAGSELIAAYRQFPPIQQTTCDYQLKGSP